MKVLIGTYHVFGSGTAAAELKLDGRRVTAELCRRAGWALSEADNGFVGWIYADIPVWLLRATREVETYYRATPPMKEGVTRRYSGRGFVRRLTRVATRDRRDPLTVPLTARPDVAAVMCRRTADAMIARGRREGWRVVPARLAHLSTVLDRRGRRVVGAGNWCGHSGPEWSRFLSALPAAR